MSTVSSPTGASFARKRRQVVVSIASIGAMAGLSLAGATPALAATDADCLAANTVDADAAGTETDIQNLLNDVTVPVVCLSGTFVLTTTLNYDRNLTIFGLPGAVLDGNNLVRILDDALLNSALTVENLRLTQGGNGAGAGGAVSADIVFVQNSIFDNNSANLGGAISASEATIEGSTFTDNLADFGGAVVVVSDVTVTDSTFALNEAGTAGGAIISYGTATVNSSTFADNSGGSAGGAIVANSGVDVINSTFVGNSTDDGGAGGAIAAFQGAIVQSTFVDNSTGGGDGESLFSTASEDGLTIQGNIFAGTGAAAQVGDSNTVADLGGNIFSTSAANEAFLTAPQPTTAFGISTALLFNGAGLADNGGPTQTVALYAGSPAVNFVPAALASVTVDQRGVARDSRSDAGAFEFPPTLAATGPESIGVLGGAAALLLALGGLAVGVTRRLRFRQ